MHRFHSIAEVLGALIAFAWLVLFCGWWALVIAAFVDWLFLRP